MKKALILVLALLVFGTNINWSDNMTPESVGAKLLIKTTNFPQAYQEAIKAVIKKLDKPEEFYVKIEKKGNILIFHLWHKIAFEGPITPGNPGGKCRDIYYDLKLKKITKILFWQ